MFPCNSLYFKITFVSKINKILEEHIENVTTDDEISSFIPYKAAVNEPTTEIIPGNFETTSYLLTRLSENKQSTEVNDDIHNPIRLSTLSTISIDEKEVSNKSLISSNMKDTTITIMKDYEISTTTIETTIEFTTTDVTTTTATISAVRADCPIVKDCPFDYCTFARKLDHHGCPTCNCLRSNKSSITCPILVCQACLYGHYTDPNGVWNFL